jgi:hypothetical protein
MGKLTVLILLVVTLTGCAASLENYGNFIGTNAPDSLYEIMVADTVKQLVEIYPPASTRFDLGQTTTDAYGTLLVDSLRTKGYALLEFKPLSTNATTEQPVSSVPLPGLSFHYLLDAPDSTGIYRVLVMVGSTSLGRAYLVQNNIVSPAGAWARKE